MTDVQTALALAERGWHVFPVDHPDLPRCAGVGSGHDPATCTDRGKHPTVSWKGKASTDPQDVAAWFTGYPRNVGIACGPSGLLVIDEDTPGGLKGYAASVGEAVPDTYTVSTGRGVHHYFHANGHSYSNATRSLAGHGVDVRGSGGYVVGPGSTHRCGALYEVAKNMAVAPVPGWLHDALTSRPTTSLAGDADPFATGGLAAVPKEVGSGERHDVLMRFAASLRARNTPTDEAVLLLRHVWQQCEQPPDCAQPYTWGEAVDLLRDVYQRYPTGDSYAADSDPEGNHTDQHDALLGRVLRRSELADLPPLTPLVHGLLDYPSAGVLVGDYGLGKTFLAVSLACSVATGRSWLGQPVERRKVLLVVGEGGSGLDRRIAAWEQGYNRNQPVADDDLVVVVQPESLTNGNVWQRITERCDAEGVGFVILDTFSSLAPDADETKDAATTLRRMHNLAGHINGTVLLVHHPGWGDKTRTRGGYQFEGNADTVLVLGGTPDAPEVNLTRKKHKDGQAGQVFWMRRNTCQLHGQHAGHTSVVMQSINATDATVPMVERIKVVLEGCGEAGATGPQVMADLGEASRSTFYKAIGKALHDDVIVKRGEGQRQRYYLHGTG